MSSAITATESGRRSANLTNAIMGISVPRSGGVKNHRTVCAVI